MIVILSFLSVVITAFLLMIAIQLLRIEKQIGHCSNIVEMYVKRLYHRT